MTDLIEELCSFCHGDGYVQSPVYIFGVCKLCGGTGRTDWISNINKTPKQIDNNMIHKLFQNNIERLVCQIREECYQATGMYAHIEIKMENSMLDQIQLIHGLDYDKKNTKNKTIQI